MPNQGQSKPEVAKLGKVFLSWIIFFAVAVSPAAGQVAKSETGLIPPPAIHIPYGGKIVTDINFSDSDVLGIIKQVLPSIGDLVAEVVPKTMNAGGPRVKGPAELGAALSNLNFKELSEAISGIKNIRAVVAVYGSSVSPERMLEQWDKGVAKTGTFSRVVSDIAMLNGAFALYAQPDNSGYIGFAYEPGSKVLYAVRIVGFVDVAKLTKWAVDAARLLMGAESPSEQPGKPETPEVKPNDTPAEVQ